MVALLSVIGKYKCYCSPDVEYELRDKMYSSDSYVIVESVLFSIFGQDLTVCGIKCTKTLSCIENFCNVFYRLDMF